MPHLNVSLHPPLQTLPLLLFCLSNRLYPLLAESQSGPTATKWSGNAILPAPQADVPQLLGVGGQESRPRTTKPKGNYQGYGQELAPVRLPSVTYDPAGDRNGFSK